MLWLQKDIPLDTQDIEARIDGVYYQYAGFSNSIAFHLILSLDGTEYRACIWVRPVSESPDEVESLNDKHKNKVNHFLNLYSGSSRNKIVDFFLRQNKNPVYRQALKNTTEE